MRKLFKLLGFVSFTLILFLVVAIAAFYHLVRVGEFRRFLISEIETRTGMRTQLGAAELEVGWITGVVFRDFALSEPESTKPVITAEQVVARVALTPLLRRQIIIYEVRVQKPTATLVRNQEGRLPLLEKLLHLPFFRRQDSEFNFDLHALKLAGGDIGLIDQRPVANAGSWRLIAAELEIERLRGQRLRDVMQNLLSPSVRGSERVALGAKLKGVVLRDDAKIDLQARGRIAFPEGKLEFYRARWDGDVQLVNFPATLIKSYFAAGLPIKSLTGTFAQRLHFENNPQTGLRVRGDIQFKQLALDAPELLLAPLPGVDGRTTYDLEWSDERLQVNRAEFRGNEIKFSLHGDISAMNSDDPHIRMNLSGLSAPAGMLAKYLPLRIVNSPELENAVGGIRGGTMEIKQIAVDSTLGELRRLAENGGKPLGFEAQLRDFAMELPVQGALPLRQLNGQIRLAGGILTFSNFKGDYGDSRFNGINGSYHFLAGTGGNFELSASGDVNLAELKAHTEYNWFPLPSEKIAASMQEVGGRAKVDLNLRRSPQGPIQFDGKAVLDNARVRYDRYAISGVQGHLLFTPKEIKGENVRAQLDGSPIEIQMVLNDYAENEGSFDVTVASKSVKAGLVAKLLLDSGNPQVPGIVRGSVRYWGALNAKGTHKFTGQLNLVDVELLVHPLLQPLRELNGAIRIDEAGIDFQNLTAQLVGEPARVSGRWRYTESPRLLFDFSAPNLDITYLISQIDPESSKFYATLVAQGTIELAKGRIKNFDFSDMKTNATIDHRVWRLTNLTARSSGGTIQGVTTIFDRPETLQVLSTPKIEKVPIQSFLNWFGATTTDMSGNVNLIGKLETKGKNDAEREQNLNGYFDLRIDNGTINRMRILVQILNLLDLSRWFTFQLPDLTKQGIRFRSITGNFSVAQGVFSTENLLVDSDDLRMTGVGKINLPKNELDFTVAVRPFPGIDSAINQIPILGRGIAAIKNSFLVASFNITGNIDDPTITPAPLGTLSEMFWSILGIPKSIIGAGAGQKKPQPNPPVEPPIKAPVK